MNKNKNNPFQSVIDDGSNIGTTNYKGIAYFGWHRNYKHTLREVSRLGRKTVHDAWIKAGLDIQGTSAAHNVIIHYALKGFVNHMDGRRM